MTQLNNSCANIVSNCCVTVISLASKTTVAVIQEFNTRVLFK